MQILMLVLSGVIGYLLGCIPSGVLISRYYGRLDIRKTGSGNAGTTNVLRTLGWLPSILTLVGDCLKGVLAALIGKWLGGEYGMLLGGFMAVVGHDFPVFLGFKGGKGIATSLGITIVICPLVAPFLLAIVFILVPLTRYMTAGTLTAALSYPVLFWFLMPDTADRKWTLFCHRGNIKRLLHGNENRLDFGHIGKLSGKHFRSFRDRHKKGK